MMPQAGVLCKLPAPAYLGVPTLVELWPPERAQAFISLEPVCYARRKEPG